MEKILVLNLQEFHLDVDAMIEDTKKIQREKNVIQILPPGLGLELIKKLKKNGYAVFVSAEVINDIPKSFLIHTYVSQGRKPELHFYEAAESLGINWFKSGCNYTRSEY